MDEIVPEIRDDLELPTTRVGPSSNRKSKWSWILDLLPGQSAILRAPTMEELEKVRNVLGSTAYRFGKQHNRQFTVRTLEPDEDTGQFRCAVKRIDGTDEERFAK